MVRSIVGTLVDVGSGKASPGDDQRHPRWPATGRLPARSRRPTASTLWEVGYDVD